MEDDVAGKLRRLEHHGGEALPRSIRMEDLPLQEQTSMTAAADHIVTRKEEKAVDPQMYQEIQPLVISLLSLKEAARTSLVARDWRKLWTCYPNLCFAASNDWSTEEDIIKLERTKFIKTINSIIQQHSGIGLNKFSIRFSLQKNSLDHLDKWIRFATSSKVRIIEINLWPKRERRIPGIKFYNFPLEALGAQDDPFIESLFLKDVSIKPHSDMCGFTKLRRLLLHDVEISGDLPGLLNNCCALEDLELIGCNGVAELYVPHQLDRLRYLHISRMRIHKIDFHVTGLTHFEYKGGMPCIALHGCSNLEKVVLSSKYCSSFVKDNNALVHAFTAIPSISAVKVLHLYSEMKAHQPVWASQMTGPMYTFMFLRHLTCEISVFTEEPNSHDGIIQFAHYLSVAPRLEMLQLHLMYYKQVSDCWRGEATGEEVSSFVGGLHHLKEVYMSGFRCYRPQILLLCGILKKGASVERVTIQPMVTIKTAHSLNTYIPERKIREWACCTSERFGKAIDVLPVHKCSVKDPWL